MKSTAFLKRLLAIVALFVQAGLAQNYTITDLGNLPGDTYSVGYGINASGKVTGFSATSRFGAYHAFMYSAGTGMTDLGSLGGTFTVGQGVNDSDQVVGVSNNHAFLYSASTGMVDLNTLVTGGSGSILRYAFGINNAGQIAGEAGDAFFYSDGIVTDLGLLPGGNYSIGYSINNSGQVIGEANTSSDIRAFLYSGGVLSDLGTLPGHSCSFGFGINASGQTAGYSSPCNDAGAHAFLYSAGSMVDLGTLPGGSFSKGFGINSLGQVVGLANTSTAVHAFIYSAGIGMVDLNTLLPDGSGWSLEQALAINDTGQITGAGFSPSGEQHAFLLSPQASCLPRRPVAKDIIQDYGNIPPWSKKGLPHTGIDYRSPLGNGIPSVGPNGTIHKVGTFTKPDANQFGSINPSGAGPAIWVKHTLQDGTPIYVLYGHTATTWMDNSTGSGKTFNFDATYTLQWRTGDRIGADTVMGKTAPFYNGGVFQPHLHLSVFKPKMACKNNTMFCEPPTSGWGYNTLSLPTGDYINPESFFIEAQYCLAN